MRPTCWRKGCGGVIYTQGGCNRCGFKLPTPEQFKEMQMPTYHEQEDAPKPDGVWLNDGLDWTDENIAGQKDLGDIHLIGLAAGIFTLVAIFVFAAYWFAG